MKHLPLHQAFRKNQVSFAYLFGSKAKGTSHPRSDRDIAIHFKAGMTAAKRHQHQIQLWNHLSDVWPGETIDLVVLEEAPLLLRFNVVRDGRLLYSKNEKQRIRFEVPTMREYFDRQYYIERGAKQALKAYARQGLS